jgi:hypothetical protein
LPCLPLDPAKIRTHNEKKDQPVDGIVSRGNQASALNILDERSKRDLLQTGPEKSCVPPVISRVQILTTTTRRQKLLKLVLYTRFRANIK